MTFQEMQNEVMDRLGQTSGLTRSRVGRSINERYRWLASSIGLQTTARSVATANTVVGNSSLTFGPTPVSVEKILAVYDAATSPVRMLGELSFDEMRNYFSQSGKASAYAIQLMGASSVTIFLNAVPTAIYTLTADVETNLAVLSGSQVPVFAESFHDLLIYGAMATELEALGKYDEAKIHEKRYEMRCSDLRYFIAKSAYREMYQGKTGRV